MVWISFRKLFLTFTEKLRKGRLREEVIYAVSFGHLQGYPHPKDAKVHSTWCKHRILALAVVKISFQISNLILFLFFAVALLMPHFLPETKSTSDEICTRLKNPNDQNHTIEKEIEVSINDNESVLVIPCLIFGIWLFLVGFGFVWHAFKGLNLPKHHAAQLVKSSEVVSPLPQESPFKHKIGLISLGVIFYFLTCGVDSYFQSQTYTVGLCGLSLSAQMAGWLNRYTYQFSLFCLCFHTMVCAEKSARLK